MQPSIDLLENTIGRQLPLAIPMKERLVVAVGHSKADCPLSALSEPFQRPQRVRKPPVSAWAPWTSWHRLHGPYCEGIGHATSDVHFICRTIQHLCVVDSTILGLYNNCCGLASKSGEFPRNPRNSMAHPAAIYGIVLNLDPASERSTSPITWRGSTFRKNWPRSARTADCAQSDPCRYYDAKLGRRTLGKNPDVPPPA
jgi:hypothetical protein